MNDPLWVVHADGRHYTYTRREDAEISESARPGSRLVKYLPESQQPPLAFCSGQPCTVLTTSYYERLLADAEKWLVFERMAKGGGS